MSRWSTVVVLSVLVATITTTTVDCNYSIASGGGKAMTSEVKGDSEDAKQRGHHVEMLAQDSAERWTDWAKEKIQGTIGLIGAQGGGEAKEKASQTVNEASKKLKAKYEQGKEKTNEVVDEEL